MPPDYIQVPPVSAQSRSEEELATSRLIYAVSEFAKRVYAQAVAQYNRIIEDGRKAANLGTSQSHRATADDTPLRLDPANRSRTPLEIEVDEITKRYESHLLKVPDLASALKPPSENFSQLIENATGRRTSELDYLVRVDPRSFDFANLLIFAYDRGYKVTSTIGNPGEHGDLSFHYDGRAIDIQTKGLSKQRIEYIRNEFARLGVRCYDETIRSNWTEHTTGYHLHFDTATQEEVNQRWQLGRHGGTRIDLGIGDGWPARR
jgi:hypothetical protein